MPKAVVTGATGYIGSHVVRHLLNQGWEIGVIAQPEFGYGNVEDIKQRLDIFEFDGNINNLIDFIIKANADVVMHLAAAVITDYKPNQVSTLISSNIGFGTQVLEAMKFSRTRLFIGTGSYWQNYNSESYNPVDLYAATKEAFEKILQYYVDAYGFRAITLRLFDVYGEDDCRPKLWTLLRDIAGTERYIDLSPGAQMIDLIHISDVARAYEIAYELLVKSPSLSNEIYGVNTGSPKTLKDTVAIFQSTLGKRINIHWGGKPYKQREVMVPPTSYVTLPTWKPMVDLVTGFGKFNLSR